MATPGGITSLAPSLSSANSIGLGNGTLQGGAGASFTQPAGTTQAAAASPQGAAGTSFTSPNGFTNYINAATTQENNTTNQISALLKSIQAEEQANVPGVAPSLNLNAINAQAQSAAQKSVNPLYTQYLNQYLQQEATNQQAAQAQNTLNLQGEQTSLGNTLAQNQLQQNAAANTNALQQGNINVQQQNYELQSGNAQNQKMQAIGQSIGSGSLGASGLGQQQLYEAENARNIADAAQRGSFQYERDTSNLSTQDTFAQLAQSSNYAKTAEGQAETQTNFNLNDYLRQAAYNDSQYQQALEASRQEALTSRTSQLQAQLVQQQLAALNPTGSKNYAAGEQAYSNLLNPSLGTAAPPSQSQYLQALSPGSAV